MNVIVTDDFTSESWAKANTDIRQSWGWSWSSGSCWGRSLGRSGWDRSIDTKELKNNIDVIILGEVNIKGTNIGEVAVSSPIGIEFEEIDSILIGCYNSLSDSTY